MIDNSNQFFQPLCQLFTLLTKNNSKDDSVTCDIKRST